MTVLVENWNYLVVICLMMGGLFIVISQNNLVKKLVGLAIFQTSVFLFYISVGKIAGGTAPILKETGDLLYSNPLPHVLILTAIVVGVATMVATPTTMAVRISTWGSGFEYSRSPVSLRIGAVPPAILPTLI